MMKIEKWQLPVAVVSRSQGNKRWQLPGISFVVVVVLSSSNSSAATSP
jgi:hypothetical protein